MHPQLPSTPFLLSDPALGLSPHRVRSLIERGEVRRLLTGVGMRGDQDDTVEARARAAQLVLRRGQVVVDHSAAWLHGVDVGRLGHRAAPAPLEVADRTGLATTRRQGADGCKRSIPDGDVMRIHGVPVTTPVRTAADLACRRGRLDAMAVLDAFARVHGVGVAEHRPLIARFAGRRGVTQYRELVPLLDARAESPRESWTRLSAHDAGIPPLELQVPTYVPGVGWTRLDLGDRALRICVEYDGADFHGPDDRQAHDERRRAPLRDAGWAVVIVRAGDFTGTGLERWIGDLRSAFAERGATGKRRWARGEGAGRHRRRS